MSSAEPPTEPIGRSQEQTGQVGFSKADTNGILPGFGSYKAHHTGLICSNLKEHEVLWTGADLSRSRTDGGNVTRSRTWRDPQPEIDERCCATLDTGCQRMAVGRDTLGSLSQAMPQELTIGTLPQEHRFRSVHGRSSTSRVAVIPTSLGHKGSVLRPAIFEEQGSRGAPFLISLPFMMFCRSVLHLDPEDGLRIYFRKFRFSIRCHIGPTAALRIPLNHFTPEQLHSVQTAQRTFQENNNEFEVYKMSEYVEEPSGSKTSASPRSLEHGANDSYGDRQQESKTGSPEGNKSPRGMAEVGAEATLRGTLYHPAGLGHPRDQDAEDPPAGEHREEGPPSGQGPLQCLRAEGPTTGNSRGSGGISGQLGDGRDDGARGVFHTLESTDYAGLLAGQDRRPAGGDHRPGDEGTSGSTTDLRPRRTVSTHEGPEDRRIGRTTLLEMRPAIREEVQSIRLVQVPTMAGTTGILENAEHQAKTVFGGNSDTNGVHLLRGGPLCTQEYHDTGVEQLHLSGEVQGLRKTGEDRTASLGRSSEWIPEGQGEGTTIEQVRDTHLHDHGGHKPGGVRGLQEVERESATEPIIVIEPEEQEVSDEMNQKTVRQARAAITEAEQVQQETMSLLREADPEKSGWSQFRRAVFDGSPLSKRRLKSFSKILGLTPRNLLTVAELYNPERFAQPAKKLGLLAGEAYDLQLGDDLLESDTRERAKSYFKTVRPGLVVISPPCTLFSRLQQLSKWKTHDPESMERYLRRLRQAKVLLHFGLEIAQVVKDYQGVFVFEHPLTSEAWQLPKMQKFLQGEDVLLVRGDQCMYGLVDYNGERLQKPTGWMTNSPSMVQRLGNTCDRQHAHAQILGNDAGGSRSAQAQHYPKALVTAILLGYRDHLRRPDQEVHWTREGFLRDQELQDNRYYYNVLMTEEEKEPPESGRDEGHSEDKEQEYEDSVQIDEEIKSLPRERPFSTEQLVRKAHEGMGHPGNDRLVRILKAAKASPEAIKIARELQCSVCQQHQHTRTPRPAAPPKELKLNSVVGVDTLYLPSWNGKHRAALNIVDWASRFQMIVPLSGPNPAAARQAYLRWVRFFGPPSVLKVDLGREFIGAFELGAELDATVIEPSSLEMPTQRSITERAGRSFKEIFSRAMMHHVVDNEHDWLNLVDITSMTANRLMNKSGYSPIQRVLGYTPRLPGGLLTGGQEDLSSTSRFLVGDVQMQKACQMRLAAATAFHEADCSQALSNAIHAGRRKTTDFQVGQVVYFWRKATDGVKKNAPRFWRGPARVVLTNPPTAIWCTFNGNLVKAAPEQVRAASPEEMFSVSEWMDGLAAARESLEKVPKRGYIDITEEDKPPPDVPPPEDLQPEEPLRPKHPIRSKTKQEELTFREEDSWELTDGVLRRLHRVPRRDLFHPADFAEH